MIQATRPIDEEKVKQLLAEIAPALEADGGGLEFVKIDQDQGLVYIKLQGACQHCSLAPITLKWGIEEKLKQALPEVVGLVAIDDEENQY